MAYLLCRKLKEFFLMQRKYDTPVWNVRTNAFYQKLGYIGYKEDHEFIYYRKNVIDKGENKPVLFVV